MRDGALKIEIERSLRPSDKLVSLCKHLRRGAELWGGTISATDEDHRRCLKLKRPRH
jgi:hypothetical protein